MTTHERLALILCTLGTFACASGALAQSQTGSVVYLVPTLDDDAFVSQVNAAKKKAAEYPGITFDFQASAGRANAPDLIAKIEAAVTRGVDVIVVDPSDVTEQLTPSLNRALNEGVMVVTTSAAIPTLENPTARIEFNDKAAAVPGGKFMAEHLREGDEVALIRCAIGDPTLDAREEGFREGLEGSGITVVVTGDAHCDPLQARGLMENWITAYPNLKGVLSDTDIALVGAVEAMKAANLDLVAVGHDGQQAVLKMIDSGEIVDATVILPFWTFGEVGVETAARLIAGEEVPTRNEVPVQGLVTSENAKEMLDLVSKYLR